MINLQANYLYFMKKILSLYVVVRLYPNITCPEQPKCSLKINNCQILMASSLTDVLYRTLKHALLLISVTNNGIKTFI